MGVPRQSMERRAKSSDSRTREIPWKILFNLFQLWKVIHFVSVEWCGTTSLIYSSIHFWPSVREFERSCISLTSSPIHFRPSYVWTISCVTLKSTIPFWPFIGNFNVTYEFAHSFTALYTQVSTINCLTYDFAHLCLALHTGVCMITFVTYEFVGSFSALHTEVCWNTKQQYIIEIAQLF